MKACSHRVGEIRVFQKSCVQTQKRSEIITDGNRLWSGCRRRYGCVFFYPPRSRLPKRILSVLYTPIIAFPLTPSPVDFIKLKRVIWRVIRAQKLPSNFIRRALPVFLALFSELCVGYGNQCEG